MGCFFAAEEGAAFEAYRSLHVATLTEAHSPFPATPLYRSLTWWALAFPIVMIAALATRNLFLLNWIHVIAGALWTGADLFMGFILGPVLRRLEMPARTAVIAILVPRTLLYFPMVSLTTTTAGWFLAGRIGFLDPAHPQFPWVVGALVLVALMTVQGLGIFLPNALRIWLELQKAIPNRERIIALNRINIFVSGLQGLMQIAIILIMAHFVIT
jgi:uncharacterized membrane protein